MSRVMGPTNAKLIVILLISAILALESATVSHAVEDLLVVQCKHHCKHGLQNQKKCEDRCNEKIMMDTEKETPGQQPEQEDPFCEAFCKHFLEDEEGIYERCMTVCPRSMSIPKMMTIEREQEVGRDGVVNEALPRCKRKCASYIDPEVHRICMTQCSRSITSKTIDNEAVCETSCTVLQEKPLSIECIKVCHERIPEAVDAST